MINSVIVTNSHGETLPLTLARPDLSGLAVIDISGLGPAASIINTRENSFTNGSIFTSSKTGNRNIVFTFKFLPRPTIEATRLRTYKFFQNESRVRLDFTTESGTFYIYGYVETNEPVIFSSDAGTVISILCPDPAFRSATGFFEQTIAQVAKMFTFPFSNEIETIGDKKIIFGEKRFEFQDFVIPFSGSINVGPKFKLEAVGGIVVNPTISFFNPNNPEDPESLMLRFPSEEYALQDGDVLIIECARNNKSVTRYVAATDEYFNYIGTVDIESVWPVLRGGDNKFGYSALSGGEFIRFTYSFTPEYSGI